MGLNGFFFWLTVILLVDDVNNLHFRVNLHVRMEKGFPGRNERERVNGVEQLRMSRVCEDRSWWTGNCCG